jgi:hypothetical protein
MRPETTYEDLRNADGNTGNVKENKSLYWHPTVYKVQNGIYKKVDIYFTSSYYIWTTGQATAFPDGFKMVAGFLGVPEARAQFECVGCEKEDEGDEACLYTFFPQESCDELEVSMAFPTCWDGLSIDSEDHMSHVSYDIDGGRFDGDCPASHPVKIPEIQLFFRIVPYEGGTHVFADGTNYYHADYFSGWDSKELQTVLDKCENESEAANPDAWCEDFVTFRDAPKTFGEDENIVRKLQNLQPDPFDTSTITDEIIDNTSQLPRGACTGILKPTGPTSPAPTLAPVPPTPTPPTPAPKTPAPTVPVPTNNGSCQDSPFRFSLINFNGSKISRDCKWVKNKPYRCRLEGVDTQCPNTCDMCDICIDSELRSRFIYKGKKISRGCDWVSNRATKSRCKVSGMKHTCRETCGQCKDRSIFV